MSPWPAKSAAAGPCTSSLVTMRCQYFQPCVDRLGLVAGSETLGICACSRIGSTALDSPENAGPISATILSVLTPLVARLVACVGSPWLSYLTSVILTLGLVALYASTARFAPFHGPMTSAEAAPDRSPMKPILIAEPLLLVEDEPHAEADIASAMPAAAMPETLMKLRRKAVNLSRWIRHWIAMWGVVPDVRTQILSRASGNNTTYYTTRLP